MTNLQASTVYYYSVGSEESGYSKVFEFLTGPYMTSTRPLTFLEIADMGAEGFGNATIARLRQYIR